MSKYKNLIIDIEASIANGDLFEDIIAFVQTETGCDYKTASDLVFEVEGQICMEEEWNYYEGQEVLFSDLSEESIDED